jgi:uncharacterized protein YecE (DUF72 family)
MAKTSSDEPFAAQPRGELPHVRVGVGGWTFEPWRKHFYPAGLPQRRELEYASRQLTTIEVNGTFYGGTKAEHFANWREQTPPGFVFSLKGPQSVTHRGTLANKGPGVERFVAAAAHLQDRLGPILWQFDAGSATDRVDLAAFAALLPAQVDGLALRHVFELRDPAAATPDALAIARAHGIATVFTDSEEHPSFADITADFVYARLMRSRPTPATGYPAKELDAWAERARRWAKGSEPDDLPKLTAIEAPATRKRDVFVYFISAAKQNNPAAAQALLARLR